MKKQKVIIALAATAAAGTNPYLDKDGHANIEKIQQLQVKVAAELKTLPVINEKGKAIKPPKPIATFAIKRNAKPVPYSKSSETKGDLKYLTKRAIVISTTKRLTERAEKRKMALLVQYDADAVGDKLAKASALAAKAIAKHQKSADKTKTSVTKIKTKERDAVNKIFEASLKKIATVLEEGGVDEKNVIMSKGGLGGLSMLVNLGGDNVISIGKSDMAKFKAAKKALTAA